MTYLHILLASAAGLAWIPVLVFFFKNFRERKNPVSLAIGTMVALMILYIGPVDYWITSGATNKVWVLAAFDLLSLAVCLFFYLAIKWSEERFRNDRRSDAEKMR